MNKLLELVAHLTKSITVQESLRERLRHRLTERVDEKRRLHKEAEILENQGEKLRRESAIALKFGPNEDQKRGASLLRKAKHKEAKARHLHAAAGERHDREIALRERIREKTKVIHGQKDELQEAEHEVAALGPSVDLKHNKVTGGTISERWVTAGVTAWKSCASNRRRNAYSQLGAPDIQHPFGPGPAAGRRDDCSSFVTSLALACGFDDPNGLAFSGQGFTGTLVGAHGGWRQVSLQQMIEYGMGYIVYGGGSGHHTEAYCPSKTDRMRTIGHGSPPVDPGTVHLFGPSETERYFIYAED